MLDACAGAADAAEALTNRRNPQKCFLDVLVPLAAEAGGACAARRCLCMDERHKPKQLRSQVAAGTGKNGGAEVLPPVSPSLQ